MNQPLVAVITRTKNRPQFLRRALKSVSAQVFRDYVHVIVNDGGNATAVDQATSELKGQVQVEHLDTSLGRGGAANVGLKRSESTLVVFHDDDDTWAPMFLEKAVSLWRQSGRKGVVTAANRVVEREREGEILEVHREPFLPHLKAISLAELSKDNCIVNLAFLAERSAIIQSGGYDETIPLYEDWDFNLRFFERFDVAYLAEPLANYHHRESAVGPSRNSFDSESSQAADARALMLNRWLRRPGHVGMLMALGSTTDAVHGMRERIDKAFNLLHGARKKIWPLNAFESWLEGS